MDTRDHTLTKLTWLHDISHPTHHRPASLWWNYSCMAVSIMKLVMEEGWWWRWRRIPPLWSPERTPDQPSRERLGLGSGSVSWNAMKLSSWFFSPRDGIYGVGVEVGRCPAGLLDFILSPKILINSEKCLRGFPGHSENFSFLHIKQHHGSSAENSVSAG